jgi:pyruvate-formate lyase-activating enzyme
VLRCLQLPRIEVQTLPFYPVDPAPVHRGGAPSFAEGFHALETEDGLAFRWMSGRGRLAVTDGEGGRFLELWVRTHYADLSQSLELDLGPETRSEVLVHGWNALSIALPRGCAEVDLRVDKLFPAELHPGDARELAIQIRPPLLHGDTVRHARMRDQHAGAVAHARRHLGGPELSVEGHRELRFGSGFYRSELDEGLPFRWMSPRGQLLLAPAGEDRYLELRVHGEFRDLSQTLRVSAEGVTTGEQVLAPGWNAISVAVPAGTVALELCVSRSLPASLHPDDPRALALRVRPPLLHRDRLRHEAVARRSRNRIANLEELLARKIVLETTPPKLGIDVQGACNVKPPCVYCAWDFNKALEGANASASFDVSTLAGYGAFYENADELVNCSIGEPFMMREIDPLLDEFGKRGQVLELTTNGQILTERNIEKLLGRDVHLYISLDASTPETYAKLRNDTFGRVLENVRRLVNAKGGPGQLPLIYLVFMPMRVNAHEVDGFVELCAQLRVDRLVLRPLNRNEGLDLRWDRAGHHFDYAAEMLPFPELVRISGRVAELCRRLGVDLSDQMDFGGDLRSQFDREFALGREEAAGSELPTVPRLAPLPDPMMEDAPPPVSDPGPEPDRPATADTEGRALPICTEPWTSLYVLRRGTLPCCYGGRPVAEMADFEQAWNGSLVRDVRRALAAGRFHRYCFESPDCPIVQKALESGRLGLRQRMARSRLRLTAWARAGWPGRAYREARRILGR